MGVPTPQAVQTAVLPSIILLTCNAVAQRRPLVMLQDKLVSLSQVVASVIWSSEARANMGNRLRFLMFYSICAAACT